MDRSALVRLGELLYGGDRYGAQMAADLSEIGPKRASQSQVSTWLSGRADIPAWVAGQARVLALKGQVDLARRSAALAELVADPEALQPAPRQSRIARLGRPPSNDPAPDEEPMP